MHLSKALVWRALSVPTVLLSALLILMVAAPASGQALRGDEQERGGEGFLLEQNYPNPFNPATRIPFVLDEGAFPGGREAVVTVRIYNVLQQYVATPVALNHPRGAAAPLEELAYSSPGRYEAYWDGSDQSGAKVASGVYFLQLVVNGRSQVRKMFVTK